MSITVKELVDYYEAGAFTQSEFYSAILDELTIQSVDAIIAGLPPDLGRGFADWAHEMFDNDLPASGFVRFKGPPMTDQALSAVRDWLRRHPKEDQV